MSGRFLIAPPVFTSNMRRMTLDPKLLLHAYSMGVFPMAESRDSTDISWIEPRLRGIVPLDGFHMSRSLARAVARQDYQIRLNTAFLDVVDACADRPETWINHTIREGYDQLYQMGYAQSLEVWREGALIGGVYGVTLGRAFFGESMFSRATNASKIALAYLVVHLNRCGFTLFDTQFITPHLATLGAVEIPQETYLEKLEISLQARADFRRYSDAPSASDVLHLRTQTS